MSSQAFFKSSCFSSRNLIMTSLYFRVTGNRKKGTRAYDRLNISSYLEPCIAMMQQSLIILNVLEGIIAAFNVLFKLS